MPDVRTHELRNLTGAAPPTDAKAATDPTVSPIVEWRSSFANEGAAKDSRQLTGVMICKAWRPVKMTGASTPHSRARNP